MFLFFFGRRAQWQAPSALRSILQGGRTPLQLGLLMGREASVAAAAVLAEAGAGSPKPAHPLHFHIIQVATCSLIPQKPSTGA